jgi:hypothetical protein
MNKVAEHLKLAANRLFRGRTSSIAGNSPNSRAVDKAISELDVLIRHFNGDGSVPNVHKALRNVLDGLNPFKSNEDVNAACLDLIEAQFALDDTTYDVEPDGEIPKKPRR